MPIDPQELYVQLTALLSERPALEGRGEYGDEQYRWLARATALIEASGDAADSVAMRNAVNNVAAINRGLNLGVIYAILHRALARAELSAPMPLRGAFIGVGANFDAYQAIGKVLRNAKAEILLSILTLILMLFLTTFHWLPKVSG